MQGQPDRFSRPSIFLAAGFLYIAISWCPYLPGRCSTSSGQNSTAREVFLDQLRRPAEQVNIGLAYWIELIRDGKTFRCNNKMSFHSGDEIRFHIIPNADGYAYIIVKSSSRGNRAVLFPDPQTGTDNRVTRGRDYVLPTQAALKFDEKPGTESLCLLLSRIPIDASSYMNAPTTNTAFVSSGRSGAKDLVPTRMQLSWEDQEPIIMPESLLNKPASFPAAAAHSHTPEDLELPSGMTLNDASLVTVVSEDPHGVLSVDVALQHL